MLQRVRNIYSVFRDADSTSQQMTRSIGALVTLFIDTRDLFPPERFTAIQQIGQRLITCTQNYSQVQLVVLTTQNPNSAVEETALRAALVQLLLEVRQAPGRDAPPTANVQPPACSVCSAAAPSLKVCAYCHQCTCLACLQGQLCRGCADLAAGDTSEAGEESGELLDLDTEPRPAASLSPAPVPEDLLSGSIDFDHLTLDEIHERIKQLDRMQALLYKKASEKVAQKAAVLVSHMNVTIRGEVKHFEGPVQLKFLEGAEYITCTLVLTNFRLMCIKKNHNPMAYSEAKRALYVSVPVHAIARVEQTKTKKASKAFRVWAKDFRNMKLSFDDDATEDFVMQKLQQLAFPGAEHVFAVSAKLDLPVDGWAVYDASREYHRQGIGVGASDWRVSEVNRTYELCDTYPRLLAVPKRISDEQLVAAAQFRSRGRLPVLCWISPRNKATITRCSQPQVGITKNRSPEDELLIQAIRDATPSKLLYVVDARPRFNAIANQAKGAGFENKANYGFAKFEFAGIDNIHVMRESLSKFMDLFVTPVESGWLAAVDSSKWLDHLSSILQAVVLMKNYITVDGASVLVHCSDGWDRTPQLTCTTLLLLEPFYRTIQGFEVLVEREWLEFGHKFAQRLGHGDDNHGDNQRSPTFLQWIDCVFQLTRQFPTAFEFNEALLILLIDCCYSCLFGTFLCNSDQQRKYMALSERTESVWSLVNSHAGEYRNHEYVPTTEELSPQPGAQYLHIWKGFYFRFNREKQPTIYDDPCMTSIGVKLPDTSADVAPGQEAAPGGYELSEEGTLEFTDSRGKWKQGFFVARLGYLTRYQPSRLGSRDKEKERLPITRDLAISRHGAAFEVVLPDRALQFRAGTVEEAERWVGVLAALRRIALEATSANRASSKSFLSFKKNR